MNNAALTELIEYAIRAPSGHNTQPWLFTIGEDQIEVRPDYTRRLPVVDADDHALFISLGCALENLVIAAQERGLGASVDYFPDDADPDVIRVRLNSSTPANDTLAAQTRARLFAAIPQRQSTRRLFDGSPIPLSTLDALRAIAGQPMVTTYAMTTETEVESVIERVEEGCREQFSDAAFVSELMHWIRFSQGEAKARQDGLAANVMGFPFVPRRFGVLMMRITAGPKREAARTARQVRSSSALMLFVAEENDKKTWVRVGRGFQRMALLATAEGLKHAHVNMPCEVPAVRERLRRELGLQGWPMLLIRLGYADAMPRAHRRPVRDVIRREHGGGQ
ncbi:nitroreductase family protein [Aquisalimonas sp.]|uniref:Acg family FMN-binding oxidoreductase n=1 Tax=Aquisalimonas sp. TaxID=1872621 RepID=UPI0025C0DB18|nr:nitroreductase family protein [Aquisalimonas sp.]